MTKKLVSLVVPFHNEEENIDQYFEEVLKILQTLPVDYEIVCVNDGSTDNTISCLKQWQQKYHNKISIIDFSRNFGKEAALTAGLDYISGEAVIPMDSDLQDPPQVITSLVDKWLNGYDVVLAKRADRSSDSLFKRLTATFFYKFYNKVAEISIPENVGDFRFYQLLYI